MQHRAKKYAVPHGLFWAINENGNGLDHQSTKNGNRKIRNQQKTATRSTKNGNGNETKKDT
jgi:hypothetical protein